MPIVSSLSAALITVQEFGYDILQIGNPTTFYCHFPIPDLAP